MQSTITSQHLVIKPLNSQSTPSSPVIQQGKKLEDGGETGGGNKEDIEIGKDITDAQQDVTTNMNRTSRTLLASSSSAHNNSSPDLLNRHLNGHHHLRSSSTDLPPAIATTSVKSASTISTQTLPVITHHVIKTVLWISLAVVVAIVVALVRGRQTALEFIAAYIVEYSLSVDNLFVFLLIFRYFKVPRESQESVLTYGILGAMLLRGIMIICGKALVNRFTWVALIFAVILIYSSVKLLFENDDDDDENNIDNLDNNQIVKFAKYILPVSDRYTNGRFFIRDQGSAAIHVTPLMVVLVSIELSDVVFALDSVPAVLGLSNDTFVIYTSNMLAIMGLRSLFFVLSSSIGNFRFLKHSLALVLAFIGLKMIIGWFGIQVGTGFSLLFVTGCLGAGVALSIFFPRNVDAASDGTDIEIGTSAGVDSSSSV